ncbi:MAG: hypothetical protein FWF69_10610 [Firmicutes bacterium]|nr:hypothetical protein [Bacillota bacterium]
MPFTLTDLTWQGAGYTFPAALPGRLLDILLASGLAVNPGIGVNSRANEWISLRSWSLVGHVSLAHLKAERVFLHASGVRGRGWLRVDGLPTARFAAGDWETEITAQAAGRDACELALAFDPEPPCGQPPQARAGIDGELCLRGVSQLKICDLHAQPLGCDGYGTIALKPTVLPYVPGRYTFRYAALWGEETLGIQEATEQLHAARTTLRHEMILPVPCRWSVGVPNKPVLLRLTVTRAGTVCDNRVLRTGFADERTGRRPFLVGADWSAPQAPPLPEDALIPALARLRTARVNCLRVYGLQTDAFYETLDREGFWLLPMLPADAGEALSVLRHVRHRPSLVGYGLENEASAGVLQALAEAQDGAHPLIGHAPAVWGPESLFAGAPVTDGNLCAVACAALSRDPEGISGVLRYWPPDTPLWKHNAEGAPDRNTLREWTGAECADPRFAVRFLRFLQAETLRQAAERARVAKAAGIFVGKALTWPVSLYSGALLDGDAPRPACRALESALRPLHACARLTSMSFSYGALFEAELFLLCEEAAPGPITVRACLYEPDGRVMTQVRYDSVPENAMLGTIRAAVPTHPCALLLRVTAERFAQTLDVCDYAICVSDQAPLEPLVRLALAAIRFEDGAVRNTGDTIAFGLAFESAAPEYPGWGALLPDEKRRILQENAIEGLNLK